MFKKTPLEQWILNKILGSARETGQLTRTLIENYQLKKLRETIALAGEKSLFYRGALGRFPVDKIRSLKDLRELPFTTAGDIRQKPLRFLCCSQDEIKRVVTLESSGTTGSPKRIFFTSADQELTKDFFHHGMTVIARPGDKVLILLPGERPGSVGDLFAEGARRMDVLAVPHGIVREPGYTLEVMEREKVDTLLGIPAQVLALASYEAPGENKFRINIKNVILNTDHLPRAIINRINKKWNCRVFNHYAMTEMGLGGGLECEALAGYHMREADLLFEIVHPVTGEVLPDGEEGEVVFTTLTRQGMPLIRYRTGDIARFIPGPCPCGTVLKRMAPVKDRVKGRVALAGGGFLSMSMLDEALFAVSGVLNFQAVISSNGHADCLGMKAQVAGWAGEETPELIQKALLSIPVVAENVNKGHLTLEPVAVDESGGLWKPAKRLIQDLRVNRKGDTPPFKERGHTSFRGMSPICECPQYVNVPNMRMSPTKERQTMKELYEECARLLADGEDVVMATIISQSGSAPRTAGTKMLVRRDGSFVGTIGGGLLEARVLHLAREVFQTGCPVIREFNLTGADAASMDMICGGRLEVFVDFLSAGAPGNAEIYRTIGNLLHSGQRALLATELPAHAGDTARFGRCLLIKDGRRIGCGLSAGCQERLLQAFKSRYPQLVPADGASFLVEPVSSMGTVYLFGAGHVSQKVARLTSMVDFRTVVLDDREGFANRQRFPQADEIIVPDDFEQCVKNLPISRDSYLVIVTRGHRYDLTVLAQALQTNAGYIGMIGSHRKRDTIYRALREAGVTEEQLAKVYSPIGLPIEAETPEEIAVSIVAELIKVRGELMGG